jgi:hypothetical protein
MIRCAMLRHAEMPKGSRRVPTVYDGFILGLPHGSVGRLDFYVGKARTPISARLFLLQISLLDYGTSIPCI